MGKHLITKIGPTGPDLNRTGEKQVRSVLDRNHNRSDPDPSKCLESVQPGLVRSGSGPVCNLEHPQFQYSNSSLF